MKTDVRARNIHDLTIPHGAVLLDFAGVIPFFASVGGVIFAQPKLAKLGVFGLLT